jgi:hypothetical protein
MSETRTEYDLRLAETLSRIDAALPHLATKAELAEIKIDLAGVHGAIAGVHGELPHLATKTEIADLRGEIRTGFAEIRRELAQLELRLVVWLGGVVVAAVVALFAALRYWPPHP